MKNLKRFLATTLCMLTVIAVFAQKPNIHILATGGTIAGAGGSAVEGSYTAGQVAIGTLLDAVPEIQSIANVTGEQIVRIGSQDMTNEVWLILAKRINELLSSPDCDGIVVTHGTDTMEETAFFLNLTVKSDKPVVLVGSMRASTSLSADGPLNLYNAVVVAAAPESRGNGVLVAMNGKILDAHNVIKTDTQDVGTFQSLNSGPLGYVHSGNVYYSLRPTKTHTINSVFNVQDIEELPKVGIVYSYSDVQADMVSPMLQNDYKGIILAGVGNGNFHKNVFPILLEAQEKGIQVVRSSRLVSGPTTLEGEVDDAKYHFVASQELNPQKARILLMLALTKTNDWKQIQDYFMEY